MQRSRTRWGASTVRRGAITLLAMGCAVDARDVGTNATGAAGSAAGAPIGTAGTPPASNLPSASGNAVSNGAASGNVPSSNAPSSNVPVSPASEGNPGASGMIGLGGAGGVDIAGNSAGAGGSAGAAGAAGEESPLAEAPCAPRVAAPVLVSTDQVLEAIATEIATFQEGDQFSTRYVVLSNRSNAGAPDCELEEERTLLAQVLATAVVRMGVPPPAAVDARRLIYRIDLRDYGFEQPLNVNGFDFVDGWSAIGLSSPFGVEFVGDAADDIVNDSGTTLQFLYASALIEQILSGVPPAALAPLQALEADPANARALARLRAPVTAADVAGDLGLSVAAFSAALPLLDPSLQPLGTGGSLAREVYSPLFLPSLCLVSMNRANVPFACGS